MEKLECSISPCENQNKAILFTLFHPKSNNYQWFQESINILNSSYKIKSFLIYTLEKIYKGINFKFKSNINLKQFYLWN